MTPTLADVKAALRVTHDNDDAQLTRLLASATREYVQFVGADPDALEVAVDAAQGIVLMVQADYEGDPTTRGESRRAAEALWMPYRDGMGL